MVDFGDMHWAILQALDTKLEELVTDGDLKASIIGELRTVPSDKYPVCFIIPKRDPKAYATTDEILHKLRTWIVIIIRGADPEDLTEKIVKLTGKVFDKIKEDTGLGGTIEDIKFNDTVFDYSLGKDYCLNWSVTEIDMEIEV